MPLRRRKDQTPPKVSHPPVETPPLSPEEIREQKRQVYIERFAAELHKQQLDYEYLPFPDSPERKDHTESWCFKNRKTGELTELGEVAQEWFHFIQEKGLTIVFGKLLSQYGGEYSDFIVNYFLGGKIENKDVVNSLFHTSVALDGAVHLGQNAYPAGDENYSLAVTFLENIHNLIGRAQAECQKPEAQAQLATLAQHLTGGTGKGNVMSLVHSTVSASYTRGYRTPLRFLYVLPNEEGRLLEQEIAKFPRLLEAVSEMIVYYADKDLTGKQQLGYNFPYLNSDSREPVVTDRSQTRMHEPGMAKKLWALFSIYKTE